MRNRKTAVSTRELVVFAMLGSIMFLSKIIMEWIPNVHFLAMFTVSYTLVYRKKALIPLYVYIMLNGIYAGFAVWWVPYLYIWTILWAVTMLLPKNIPPKLAVPVYMVVCGLHGLCFGLMYAPSQALFFGLNLEGTIAWIIAGLPMDCIHALGDFAAGSLVLPLSRLIQKLENQLSRA